MPETCSMLNGRTQSEPGASAAAVGGRRPKLLLRGITKKYASGEGVEGIDLTVYEGELVSLLGPSGCGKTTILRVIGGFLVPDAGEIILDGVDIAPLPPEKRPTAMVFQNYNLWPHMSVFENLAFGLRLRKVPTQAIREQVAAGLALVHMSGSDRKYPSQLSGGQQQRVAIARALLIKPSVLLLDEPFSALDAKIRSQMREELKKLQTELNITVIFVTHDQEEAMAISDRIVVMNRGCFEQIGSPAEVYDFPETLHVARFIGAMNFVESDGAVIGARPENLQVRADEGGELAGKIETLMVMGHFVEMTIASDKGALKAFLPREQAEGFRPGQRVSVSIAKHKVFPVEGASRPREPNNGARE